MVVVLGTGRRALDARILDGAYVIGGSLVALSPPGPVPAGVGLDASWAVAISRAAHAHLVFGRDIVFSYGPFGYLITSIADVGNFGAMVALQLAVAALILTAVVVRLREPASTYQKTLLVLFTPVILANSAFESWPPMLVLLYVSAREPARTFGPILALGAGLIGGAFTLTKFTVGIDIVVILVVYAVARAWEMRSRTADLIALAHGAAAFACGFLAASAAVFIALDDGPLATLCVEAIALGIAAAATVRSWSDRRVRSSIVAVGATAAGLAMLFAAAGLSVSYRAYIWSSTEIAVGYSAGHALEGPTWQLVAAALLVLAMVVAAAGQVGRPTTASLLALAAYEWAVFKLGFVRQDLHVLYFFGGSAFVALMLAYGAPSRRGALACGIALVAALGVFQAVRIEGEMPPLIAALAPPRIAQIVDVVAHVRDYGARVESADAVALAGDVLPDAVVRGVRGGPVDVVPAETAYAFANTLRWAPEPVFQTYMAYLPALDQLDLRSIERRSNDAMLFSFESIDGRYPLGDEPAAFRYLVCHYAVDSSVPEPARGDLVVLVRARTPRCAAARDGAPAAASWNEPIAIPHAPGRLTFADISLAPNLAGRIRSLLFRAPIVNATIRYADGTSIGYRILAANAADGVLLDPLPRNATEFAALFKGSLEARAVAITLRSNARWFEPPRIRFSLVPFGVR